MKTLHLVIILMAAGVLIMSSLQNVQAIPYMSPQDLYKQSDMVFHGQVISKQAGSGPDYYYYQIKVDMYFKNPQTSDSITVAGHNLGDARAGYTQFEVGDKALFYIHKIDGINTIGPYSQKAGIACDAQSFPESASLPGQIRPTSMAASNARITDIDGNAITGKVKTGQQIQITYDDVWNNYPEYRAIQLHISIQNTDDSKLVFEENRTAFLNACDGPSPVKWNFVPEKSGNYSSSLIIDKKFTISTNFEVGDVTDSINIIQSPLVQFKSGIAANDVKCEQGLQLVIKAEDNFPACVKLDAAYMLIKRGWAASESAYPGGDAQFVLHTNSTIIPAHLPRSSGLRIPYYEPSRVINYSGFDGVYNETFLYRGTQKDYVLKPGSTGVITFKLEAVVSEQQGQSYPMPLPKSLNLTNYVIFYHEITSLEDLSKYPGVTFDGNDYGHFRACSTGPAGGGACIGGPFEGKNPIEAYVTDHPGIDVLFEPPSEVLPLGMNTTSQVVTMMITADSNAPRGTYLVELPSIGGSFLLTVGDRPYHE
ncbi:MAG: hypothetical protein ACYC6W_02850 [Nitrosotalea sp.]